MTPSRRPLAAFAKAVLFAAIAAAALYLATRPDACAADRSDPPKAEAGTLDFVPADAVAVLSVRVADYWDHPLNKAARDALGKGQANAAFDAFRKQFGVAPGEIDRLTLFVPAAGQTNSLEPLVAVTTVKPCDRKAVLGAAAPGAKEETINNRPFYRNEHGQALAFPDDHTIVVGASDRMEAYLKRPEGEKDGPLAPVLKLAGEKHYLVGGVDVAAVAKTAPPADQLPADFKPFKPLLKAQIATLTVDLDEQLRADLKVTFGSEADAKEGTAALDDALDLARGGLVQAIKELNRFEDAPKSTALLKDVQTALRTAKAEQKGATVEVEAAMKIDLQSTAAALTEAVEKVRAAARRIEMSNDLKQLALASINYADSHDGRMLPAAVYDKNGKPLLSWRVLVLPYIEQNELYKQFHLDEPWDSDNNKKLLDKMPATFAPADSEAFKKHETFFQGFVGAGSVFDGGDLRFPASIPDGTSQTIMFAEAAKSVPWTKPDDIPFDAGKLAPRLGGLSKNGFLVAFCDGSVRFLSRAVSEETLRAIVTRDAGDVPGADLDK